MSTDLYLFARVAGTAIAIATDDIEAVVRLGEIMPIARVAPYVRGLAALRSRVLTVVDFSTRITGVAASLGVRPLAIVAEVEGHNYALIIDDVDDVCPVSDALQPVHGRIDPQWEPYAKGMILHDDRLHLAIAITDLMRPALSAAA